MSQRARGDLGLGEPREHRAPADCPVCGEHLSVTRLGCTSCGTELAGLFAACPFCTLGDKDLDAFLKAMGRSLGAPWQAQHKLAAAAALAAGSRNK